MIQIRKILSGTLLVAMACMGAQAQNVRSKNPHSQMHKQLLASQTKSSDQIKLIEQNTFIDLIEYLEPDIDIYTEGWNS